MTINFSDTFSLPIVFPSQLSCAALFSLAKFIVIRYDALVVWVDSDWDLFCESSVRVFSQFRSHVKSGAAYATLQPHHLTVGDVRR